MSDYISREAAIDAMRKVHNPNTARAVMSVVTIRELPAADVVEKEKYDRLLENSLIVSAALQEYQKADAVEVKRGEWIDGLDVPKEERERHPYVYLHGEKHCSVCFKEAYFDTDYGQQLFDYCPNCGAKMDGGAE